MKRQLGLATTGLERCELVVTVTSTASFDGTRALDLLKKGIGDEVLNKCRVWAIDGRYRGDDLNGHSVRTLGSKFTFNSSARKFDVDKEPLQP